MRRRGYDTEFATSGGVYVDVVRNAGFIVHIIPELDQSRHNIYDALKGVNKLRQVIRDISPKVIHSHNAAATIYAWAAAISLGSSIPCVTSVRGVEERSTHQWRNKVWLITPGLLLAVSENTKARLKKFGVSNRKIRVTYNGVDLNRFNPDIIDRRRQREILNLSDKIVIGSVGAMVGPKDLDGPSKGQHILVRAISNLKNKYPNIAVLLVGDGSHRILVEEECRRLGVQSYVNFVGRRFDIPEMLSVMDIYCLASIHGEFFPNSIIEAMAMGLPWVGSDIAGLGELTFGDKAGWVSPIADVERLSNNIERLIENSDLRSSMGAFGKAQVIEKLSITTVCNCIINAYKEAGARFGV
jgi:glycosyltransferase involved in cell wall biosynthesis